MGKRQRKRESPAGKGDKPRSCYNADFRENYNLIDWGRRPPEKEGHKFIKKYE